MEAADIDRNIQSIVNCEEGHPIEPIERLIAAGASALPPIHKALAVSEVHPDHDLLPLII